MKKNKEEFNIRDLVTLFLPKLWLIVLVSLVVSVVFAGYSAFIKDETYSSTAMMLVENKNPSVNSGTIDVSTKMVERCKIVILSRDFLDHVCKDLNDQGVSVTSSQIKSALTIKQIGDTEYFDVTATTKNAQTSTAIVKAVTKRIDTDIVEKLPYEDAYLAASIIDEASEPGGHDNKNVVRNALIGFAAGLVVSMVAIFLYSLFDVTIRDKQKIEDNFDIPVLGVIPRFITEEGSKK